MGINRRILEIKLINETPLFLGSYDTQFHEDDAFRTQSLKGLWRWWTRAYIAGAMYNECILLGTPFRKKEGEEYGLPEGLSRSSQEFLNKCVGKLLGSTESASPFRIYLSSKPDVCSDICKMTDRCVFPPSSICDVQRICLLRLKNNITYTENIRVTLVIELYRRDISDNEIEIAIGSLLTALTLGGLGKASRRGLGTFRIEISKENFPETLENFIKIGALTETDRDTLTINFERIQELVKYVEELCIDYVCENKRKYGHNISGKDYEVPIISSISSKRYVDYEKFKNILSTSIKIKELNKKDNGRDYPIEVIRGSKIPVFTIFRVNYKNICEEDLTKIVAEIQDFFYRPNRIRRGEGKISKPVQVRFVTCNRCGRPIVLGTSTLKTTTIRCPCCGSRINIRQSRTQRAYRTAEYGYWEDFLTSNKYCWYLGLPREQRETGYIFDNKRRASPIHVAVHRECTFISSFLSADWPLIIKWNCGRKIEKLRIMPTLAPEHRNERGVYTQNIVKVHCEVLAYLKYYIEELLGYRVDIVFP
ncbi:MAG: type III-B CRISPR module RAMP protein Cmr1 [Crenarchaeota archaeon]|nr:type III-B CRISPR module RAMP protein Cmr1 [Thermoproteota archaeon]